MCEDFQRKIKILNERIWEGHASWPQVQRWIENFTGDVADIDTERIHALHLLAHVMYFGDREMRALLKAVFRDLYKYPVIERLRRANNDTVDLLQIETLFQHELFRTRFLGIGNPSESGTHLLYHFRQENKISKGLFINTHEIFTTTGAGNRCIRNDDISMYIFLDDLAGSGIQACEYSKEVLWELKRLKPDARAAYYVLFATSSAIDEIKSNTLFDDINCIYELDESFKCFGGHSRYFASSDGSIDKEMSKNICVHYGERLVPRHPLGYMDSQLLLAFHHNTPDNTLPIIWYDEQAQPWDPIFKRYQKYE